MESAELNKGKRVRHCYPRKELYHRFIHSDEYAYSANGCQVSCKGNYIVVGNIGKKATITDIEEMWYYNSNRMIAIIDRNINRILINTKYKDYICELKRAIPDYYTIYFTNYTIPDKNILLHTKQCLKIHAKYLLEEFADNILTNVYRCLDTTTVKCYEDYNSILERIKYKDIISFIKDNNIKQYDFYKECFNDSYTLKWQLSYWKSKTITIKLPTLQQIVNGTFLTKKQKLYLEQKYFYSKYCYGRRIPFKDIIKYWNTEVTPSQIKEYLEYKYYFNVEWENIPNTWNECIKFAADVDRRYIETKRKEYIEQSKINEENALKQFKELNTKTDIIESWRKYTNFQYNEITYNKFIPSYKKDEIGNWQPVRICNNIGPGFFDNTQLRLSTDRKRIETSRTAIVPLKDAIEAFKLLRVLLVKYKKEGIIYFPINKKVGIYNIIDFKLIDKVTDKNKELGYKEWLVRIGCHNLWLDDINDFIHYYNLEKEFGIESEDTIKDTKKNNIKLKIQIKK